MARQRKRSKIFNLFKDNFKITFYHKPSMLEDDVYHIVLLDDIVRLKIKMVHNILIVDDVTPITSAYIPITYNNIINTLVNQQEFTVLLAITGNITVIESACIKVEAPIIEDPRFTCLPGKLYDELKEYYKDDKTKYGFYLLAVNDQKQQTSMTNVQEKPIKPGNIPVTEQIETKLKTIFPKFDSLFLESDNWEKGKQCKFNGIQFQITFNNLDNEISLKNFYLNEMESYQDLIKLCETLEAFGNITNVILREVSDPLLFNICDVRGYQNIENNLTAPVVLSNRKYLQSTYGSYKVCRNIL